MDEPSEVWEQPPAPPVAVPAITAHSDAQHFMHRHAKDAGKPCPCDWCEEQKKDLAEIRQMNQDLKTVDKAWRDVRRARLYEWGEMLWIPMFILIVVLSYIFP